VRSIIIFKYSLKVLLSRLLILNIFLESIYFFVDLLHHADIFEQVEDSLEPILGQCHFFLIELLASKQANLISVLLDPSLFVLLLEYLGILFSSHISYQVSLFLQLIVNEVKCLDNLFRLHVEDRVCQVVEDVPYSRSWH